MQTEPATAAKSDDRANELVRRWGRMTAARAVWLPQWQEIADLMNTRAAGIVVNYYTPNTVRETVLFDTTAGDALLTMAGGLMSWTMPSSQPWFAFDAPRQLAASDRVRAWAQACSEEMRYILANSSFYTEAHEDLINHCCFGTSALYFNLEEDGHPRFETLSLGSFCIEENDDGEVDTLFREFELPLYQAVEKFGLQNLPKSMQEAHEKPEKRDQTFTFIHAVYPRPEHERPDDRIARLASHGKPWASCYIAMTEKVIVKESGFDFFPFSCGRYLKWRALRNRTAYGYGPGFAALPDTRQINFQQMMMDCMTEKIVRPPMIADASMEGDIVLSSGGITYVDTSISRDRWPEPINMTMPGSYQLGQDRVKMRQDTIKAKFHADLWNMFASLDGIRTATEIRERAAEKIDAITPAFTRLTTEKQIPMLKALFQMLLQAKMLPPPPPEAVIPVSQFMGVIPPPDIQFTSRLAMAVKSMQTVNAQRAVAELMPIAAVRPEVLAGIDWVKFARGECRNAGMPADYLKDEDQVQAELAAQAKMQQQQQQMMMAEQGAKAAGHLGGIPAIKEAMS